MAGEPTGQRMKIRFGDAVVVVLVLAAAFASMFFIAGAVAREKGGTAIVEVNGREAARVVLAENQRKRTLTVEGVDGPSTMVFERGGVRMTRSACRDKICIHMGTIDARGKAIVCLPNRVVIRVVGNRNSGKVDTVTE